MAEKWEVDSRTGRCAATGRVFKEGEEFYTVLSEKGDTFTRADYGPEAWQGPPDGAFCFFKTRVPVRQQRKKVLVNNELLVGFFERLAQEEDPVRVQFRFVLALILMRKRLLRYEQSSRVGGRDVWTMTLMADRSSHRVADPCLTDAQIETVSAELSVILHSDMGQWAEASLDGVPHGEGEAPDAAAQHAGTEPA